MALSSAPGHQTFSWQHFWGKFQASGKGRVEDDAILAHGLSVHSCLTGWSLVGKNPHHNSQCNIQVATVEPSQVLPRYPFVDQLEKEDEQLGGLHTRRLGLDSNPTHGLPAECVNSSIIPAWVKLNRLLLASQATQQLREFLL